jgi:hypothetical protein
LTARELQKESTITIKEIICEKIPDWATDIITPFKTWVEVIEIAETIQEKFKKYLEKNNILVRP